MQLKPASKKQSTPSGPPTIILMNQSFYRQPCKKWRPSALSGRALRVFDLPEPIRYRLYIALTISDCYNQNMGATITVGG